ncbi:MAG: hypothetical protein AAGA66_10450 [Bacteroidota bacterium]
MALRLKADYPKLTNHDLKLSAYLKIGIDNKQLASMIGIDHHSAKNSVYRLKKKIQLEPDVELREFIMNY